MTVGLNPSRLEFPATARFSRFPAAHDVYPEVLESHRHDEYLAALSDYFRTDPYRGWFVRGRTRGHGRELLRRGREHRLAH
jgi:hypothetical protein